jgi:hypothetical protein
LPPGPAAVAEKSLIEWSRQGSASECSPPPECSCREQCPFYAIHLATAQELGADLARIVTYDMRMAAAAEGLGWRVAAPA